HSRMLRDLQQSGAQGVSASADVAVVGAGIAGLILATRLVKNGVRTIVLESGTDTSVAEPDPLNEVVQIGQPYRGAEKGRFRGLGGTSVCWGGAMLPFLACDMEPHTARWPVHWPVTLDHVYKYIPELERLFHLPDGP